MPPARRALTDALLSMLRAQLDGANVPLRIGDARAPDPTTGLTVPALPYAVVWPIDATESGPQFYDPHADGSLIYQLSATGARRDQCEWMADRVAVAILGRDANGYIAPISPAGMKVIGRMRRQGPLSADGPLFVQPDRYTFDVTPA